MLLIWNYEYGGDSKTGSSRVLIMTPMGKWGKQYSHICNNKSSSILKAFLTKKVEMANFVKNNWTVSRT